MFILLWEMELHAYKMRGREGRESSTRWQLFKPRVIQT